MPISTRRSKRLWPRPRARMRSICPAGAARRTTIRRATLASVALEDLGAGISATGVSHDQRAVLGFQERRSDLACPDNQVPQTIELPDDDFHLSYPRSVRMSADAVCRGRLAICDRDGAP